MAVRRQRTHLKAVGLGSTVRNTVFGEEVVSTKVCKQCKRELPITDFRTQGVHKNNPELAHYRHFCRSCEHENSRKMKGIYLTAPERPDACEICGTTEKALFVDHDHATDKVRGWLCKECNSGLGWLGDTLEAAENAVRYLRKHYG